ncbi:hypothetical protein ACGF0J_36225 [Nonomuraea sp. NPDC047897]|uniref:hypothetical protein n=1 Tax=Nonomuraea sp. NPDC047897 TaxID=3364346 RepID=UPI003721DBEE
MPTPHPAASGELPAADACGRPALRRFLDGVEQHARRRPFTPGRDTAAWQVSLDAVSGVGGPLIEPYLQTARGAVHAYVQAAGTSTSRAFQARQVRAAAVELVEMCGLAGRYRFDDPWHRARPERSRTPKTKETRTSDARSGSGSRSDGHGSWRRPRSWFDGC